MLISTGEKFCAWPEGTEADVNHQGGWLEDIRDSVSCHSDMTSWGNSGHSLGFAVDIADELSCTLNTVLVFSQLLSLKVWILV